MRVNQPSKVETRREAVGQPGPSWRGDGALGGVHPPRGSAAPGPFAELGLDPAPYQLRMLGFVVDQLSFAVLFSVVLLPLLVGAGFVQLPDTFGALDGWAEIEALLSAQDLVVSQVLLTTVYRWLWNALGWSPGKRMFGLRLVDARGAAPGWQRGLRRAAFALLSDLPLWLGYGAAMWDRERRTWHDHLAGTWVVRAKAIEAQEQQGRAAR
jgi:uncharacterized RDD family membrane protein YckC